MGARLEAFAIGNIDPPAAFDRLRRDLHDAAGPDRLAVSRTRDTIDQLRTRADFLMEQSTGLYPGTGLGSWYAELATRLYEAARTIEEAAKVEGVLS